MTEVSRRRILGWTGAGAAVAGIGAAAGFAGGVAATVPTAAGTSGVVGFRGAHQAGIVTPAQDRLHFVSLDLTTTDKAAVAAMLARWTEAAERMTAGQETTFGGATGLNPLSPPTDTGEALGLPAASLTVTIGFGASFFDKLGLADRKPAGLAPLPGFQGDRLDPALSDGDIAIQACSDDQMVAVHAARNLIRMGFGTAAVRWSQLGYGRTSSTSTAQKTPRNLFGFKDGTNNIKAEDDPALQKHVWVQPGDGPDWMTGGSYLVARRIRMHIEVWDRSPLQEQERTVGRTKADGAPLSGTHEFDTANLSKGGGIPIDAHIRLASETSTGGIRILRRGYNFVDGSDGQGHLNAGLFFIAFVRDPQKQYVPMQRTLAKDDAMSQYLVHTGSALYAVPPGLREGEHWAQQLLT